MLCLRPPGSQAASPGCRCPNPATLSLSRSSRVLREPIPLSRLGEPSRNPPSCRVVAVQSPDGSGGRGAAALPGRDRRCLRRRGYRGLGEGRGRWRGGPVGAGRAGGRSQREG